MGAIRLTTLSCIALLALRKPFASEMKTLVLALSRKFAHPRGVSINLLLAINLEKGDLAVSTDFVRESAGFCVPGIHEIRDRPIIQSEGASPSSGRLNLRR